MGPSSIYLTWIDAQVQTGCRVEVSATAALT
jgi:hypothetical protein